MKLNEKRNILDEIDAQISKLLNERFKVVEEIKEIKKEDNIPILDTKREIEVINKNIGFIEEKYKDTFIRIYKEIMDSSKDLQKDE